MKLQTHIPLVSIMWHSTDPTDEKEEDLYSFTTMAEALGDINKTPIYVEP